MPNGLVSNAVSFGVVVELTAYVLNSIEAKTAPMSIALVFMVSSSFSVGISVIALSLILLATNPVKPTAAFRRILSLYAIIAILGMSTGALSNTLPGVAILAILTSLCFLPVFVSVWKTSFPPMG
jgi:hypothetical protein